MNDKDNILKAYYNMIELGVSPLDIYVFSQVMNSDEGFGMDDREILDKTKEIRDSIDKDYNSRLTVDEHIQKIMEGDYYYDEEEELM
jgi:hypothetical protein